VIIGEKIITYWKRPKGRDQVITTIAKGALIDHNWRPDLQQKGKGLARVLAKKSGINLAAVDVVFPLSKEDPEPQILEINYFFGRRGLGGVETYYSLVYGAIKEWLVKEGLDPNLVRLV
jgi:ribosomal protein S6--L-glutamate ligase